MKARISKWGEFPALQKMLEGKPESHRYYGPTSVSDNIFEFFARHLLLSASATEHKDDLLNAVRGDPKAADAAIGDLKNVMKGLATVSDLVSKEIRELEMLCAEVDRAGHIEPH